ncbi:MAG: hypothetical protein ACSNEK_01970 [Parachlamydiaceae bacterium]
MKVEGFNHLFNPFSQGTVKLKKWQKGVAITSLVVLAPLLLFPGLIAFWGLTYYFKASQLKLHEQDKQSTANRTNSVSKTSLSSQQKNDFSIKDLVPDTTSQSKSIFLSSRSEILPLPFSNLSEAEQLQEELEFLHDSGRMQSYFQNLRTSAAGNRIVFLRLIKNQTHNWLEYLRYLSLSHFEDFSVLFGVTLEEGKIDDLSDFIKTLDLIHLSVEKHQLLNNTLVDTRLKLSKQNLSTHLELALKYDIPSIREEYTKWILENLKEIGIDAIDLFEIADQYQLESIKSQLVQEIILMHQENAGWSQLQKITLESWLPRISHLEVLNNLDDNLEPLLRLCTHLRTLKIKVYEKETIDLLKKFPNLQKIEFVASESEFFNDEDLRELPIHPNEISPCQ